MIPHTDDAMFPVMLMQIFQETLLKHKGGIKLCSYM